MSEQEARQYMERLRSAPVEQVAAELISSVLNAAQVKLGRRDARLLIDLAAMMTDQVREYVSGDLGKQIDQALAQLRLHQVNAENEAAGREPEAGDLDRVPAPPRAAGQAAPAEQPRPASRLWVPGQ
ncbi:hypothetical protein BAY60_19920 [Prauserella muralis]|uniref:Uncharacterized protein n=2 Tax=Prauserella muralis TaxID=588067 RepID=A0A2V4AQ71_9PSEU|nr:hypothetical protein BAY60_19920 [Prauserella muralis]